MKKNKVYFYLRKDLNLKTKHSTHPQDRKKKILFKYDDLKGW